MSSPPTDQRKEIKTSQSLGLLPSELADPQSGEPEAGTFTLPGDVNPNDSGDGEEV